ncbi:MAG: peptidoglycan DD-metalloendopeptidase family protein [Pseudomonadota bacterium]
MKRPSRASMRSTAAAADRHSLRRAGRAALAILLVTAVTACAGRQNPDQAGVSYRGSSPAPAPTAPVGTAGPGGIVAYDGFEAAVAREGETVSQVAERVGLSGAELGAYNGLQPDTVLREGDDVVLPPRPGGYGGVRVAEATPVAPVATAATPTAGPLPGSGPIGTQALGTTSAASTAPVEAPGAAATVAGTSPGAGAPAAQNNVAVWSPAVAEAAIERSGQPPARPGSVDPGTDVPNATIVPNPGAESVAATESAPERVAAVGTAEPLTPPPSSGQPLPPEPERPTELSSPDLGQYQTPEPEINPAANTAATEAEAEAADREAAAALASVAPATPTRPDLGLTFRRPVDGAIAVPYNISSTGRRNEGVDFAAIPGSDVVASAAGEVALVSQSLGGLGTIVLIRHRGDVLTVYGRVDNVRVAKGARVAQGEPIGTVAPGDGASPPRMHFEIRRGAESLDPELFL